MPTLPSQAALLALGAATAAPAAFVIAVSWRRTGVLDRVALEHAVADAVAATEVFSLGAVRTEDGVQIVPAAPRPPTYRAFSTEAEFRQWLDEQCQRGLPYDGTALHQAHVLDVAGDSLVLIRAHHAIIDGYGLTLVMRRIADDYEAHLRGRDPAAGPIGDLQAVIENAAAARTPDRSTGPRRSVRSGRWAGRYR